MATNVYRAEETVYYDPAEPFRSQGYHISTSTDCVTHTVEDNTWQLESRIRKLFPKSSVVRLAGFCLIADSGPAEWQDFAREKLQEELEDDGVNVDDEFGDVGGLIELFIRGAERQAS